MRRILRIRSLRYLLVLALSITVLLIAVRHYYATRVMNHFEASNEAVANLSRVHRQVVVLTLATENFLKKPAALRSPLGTASLRAQVDSLATNLPDDPELNAHLSRLRRTLDGLLASEGQSGALPLLQTLQNIQSTQQIRILQNEKQYRQELPIARVLADVLDAAAVVVFALITYFFYAFMTSRDRLTRDELRKHKQLNQYLEAIPEGVVVVNTDRQVVYVNQVGQELLHVPGLTDARSLFEWVRHLHIVHPDTDQPYAPDELPLSRALRGEIATRNLLIRDEAGERYLNSHARPLYDREEELIGAITILRDITDNVRREQALQEARLVAEQALRERDLFIANISHEIRTPLNAILGFSELLEKNTSARQKKEYIEAMLAAGSSLTLLINDLLDLSKIESDQLELEPTPTVLAEVVKGVGAVTTVKARAKGLRYELLLDADLPEVIVADDQRLQQILLNLTDNAVKFTTSGHVKLAVRPEPATAPDRVMLRFEVSDTGVGIEEDKRSYIFHRFAQVANDRLHRSGGTGLGLHIVRSLVERMGGTIGVESEIAKGTTFTVRIPVEVLAAPAPAKLRPPSPGLVVPTLRILVVEDSPMNQKVVEAFLGRYHLRPTFANDGLEALEWVKKEAFDLIFMDIQMPNMDGYTATRCMREQLGLITPIVAMTAYAMPGERRRCLEAGMNDYIAKPVRMQQLYELLHIFAPGKAPSSGNTPVAPVGSPTGALLVDKAYLWEITDGDTTLLAELIEGFREELAANQAALLRASATEEKTEFNRLAHKFCSSLNALALLRTAAEFKRLEEAVALDPAEARTLLAGLFGEIDEALGELDGLLESNTLRE